MQVKIAICDDEAYLRDYINGLVEKWAVINDINVETDTFDSAEKYIKSGKDEKYDILLLDIQMGEKSGVELARELRADDDKLIIVFITAVPDYIQEGYDLSALHYLIKPLNEDKLTEVLNRAVNRLNLPADKALIVNMGGETVRIPLTDIYYIESFAHYSEVSAGDEKYTVRMPSYKLEEQLDNNFIRCHRSYIANIKYISKITKTDVILDDGKLLPLSRRLYNGVHEAWIKYFKLSRQV